MNGFDTFSTSFGSNQEIRTHRACVRRVKVMNAKLQEFEKTDVSKRVYSTVAGSSKVHPYFITGFADGEACFSISIIRDAKIKSG